LKQSRDEDDIFIIYRILLLTKYKYKIRTLSVQTDVFKIPA